MKRALALILALLLFGSAALASGYETLHDVQFFIFTHPANIAGPETELSGVVVSTTRAKSKSLSDIYYIEVEVNEEECATPIDRNKPHFIAFFEVFSGKSLPVAIGDAVVIKGKINMEYSSVVCPYIMADSIERIEADSTDTANSADSQTGTPSDEFTAKYCTYTLEGPYLYFTEDNEPYAVLYFNWINTSDEPRDSYWLLDMEAYQNGQQLYDFTPDGFAGSHGHMGQKCLPGYGSTGYETFHLVDDSPVTFIVDSSMDISEKYDDVIFEVSPDDMPVIE